MTASISFAGCGFISVYQVGAIAALRELAPHLLGGAILGSSSGALLGVAIIADLPTEKIVSTMLRISREVTERVLGPVTPAFDLTAVFREVYEDMLPQDIAHKASGRLHVSMTKLPEFSNLMISYFTNKQDLIDALLCSSFIPMAFGLIPPKFRGTAYIDGFYSNNQPILSKDTITVTVFAGDSNICPNDGTEEANMTNLQFPQGPNSSVNISLSNYLRVGNTVVPPPTKTMMKICTQGYIDTVKYLVKTGIIQADIPDNLPQDVRRPFEEEIAKEGNNERDLSSYIFKLPVAMWQAAFNLDRNL